MDDGPNPLADEDLAILALECDTIAGHTCKVVVLDGPGVTRTALLDRLAGRLPRAPMLATRLDTPAGGRAWVPDAAFCVEDHVVEDGDGPVDRRGLLGKVAGLFEQRLDRTRPLWCMNLVALDGGGTAVVWRIHHALADGTTAARLASLLLWDEDEPAPAAKALAEAHRADDARRRAHLSGFLRREFSWQHGRSPFDGTVGTTREMGLATTSLAGLRAAAHAIDGATVNDAVLSVVAGALRRWLEHRHGPVVNLRARVPVSLHHDGDGAANRDSFFSLVLPVDEADPVARLRTVHRQTTLRKSADDAAEMDALYRELAAVSPRLREFASKLQESPRRFALSVSNVPGPRAAVTVLSAPVAELFSFAEIGQHHALRVAALSHADRLSLGFCADPVLVPEVQAMAEAAEAEAADLMAAAG
ncbi:MAG TPA: wax ester/triacylglycerol synthase domain-containing protein [Acidimicrobiales bacterium]|nr:wax ester/triacylglycerol synthase domain-containing protein [Acidimicrobiales bacterium]